MISTFKEEHWEAEKTFLIYTEGLERTKMPGNKYSLYVYWYKLHDNIIIITATYSPTL